MNETALFNTANQYLLAPYDLDQHALSRVFGQIMTHSVDYADLYFQYSRTEGVFIMSLGWPPCSMLKGS